MGGNDDLLRARLARPRGELDLHRRPRRARSAPQVKIRNKHAAAAATLHPAADPPASKWSSTSRSAPSRPARPRSSMRATWSWAAAGSSRRGGPRGPRGSPRTRGLDGRPRAGRSRNTSQKAVSGACVGYCVSIGTDHWRIVASMGEQRYVSNELSHFVGRNLLSKPDCQFKLLVKILSDGWLTHPPHNPALGTALATYPTGRMSTNDVFVEQVVCFCDIPEVDLGIHINKYGPFGLAFRKEFLIAKGANPVFYVAKNSRIQVPADLPRPGPKAAQQQELEPPVEAATRQTTRARPLDEMAEETFSLSWENSKGTVWDRYSPAS